MSYERGCELLRTALAELDKHEGRPVKLYTTRQLERIAKRTLTDARSNANESTKEVCEAVLSNAPGFRKIIPFPG